MSTSSSQSSASLQVSRPGRSLPLLVLGSGADPDSERGVSCPGELPPASDPSLVARARAARKALGDRAFILGHHYQRDEVIQFADVTGDSFKLAREAAARPDAQYVVFCGVHFMAESADILTKPEQQVVLPDLAAGCSMADMATFNQVEECWDALEDLGIADEVIPVTYMNSSADIKAFTGRHGGTVCTSSNAGRALKWALSKGSKVLFLPDQHLGRNTAVLELGMQLGDCVVWDPHAPGETGGLTPEQLRDATMILWRGHCSVHGRFSPACVTEVRERVPGVRVIVHPECQHEVVLAADEVGSTEKIISTIERAPSGSAWAVGTELNLVQRLAAANPDKTVVFLDKTVCYCSTMNRIDLPHLVWALESLVAGQVPNQITVDDQTAAQARTALEQMLALPLEALAA
ncbi:MAG TPA: quinolinate synthase NadA [Streptosporangiaceae bacterium]|jgi:quinolinate synthase|nr:quinolinate synthase NadA [Streptosporangiaceae bacterium]